MNIKDVLRENALDLTNRMNCLGWGFEEKLNDIFSFRYKITMQAYIYDMK